MEDININKLGLIIHKDKEVTIGIKEYEVCFVELVPNVLANK